MYAVPRYGRYLLFLLPATKYQTSLHTDVLIYFVNVFVRDIVF